MFENLFGKSKDKKADKKSSGKEVTTEVINEETVIAENAVVVEDQDESIYNYQFAVTANHWSMIEKNVALVENLMPGSVYMMQYNGLTGEFYLTRQPKFRLPKKIYGDSPERAAHMLSTFKKEKGNMGVLLCGMKGTGKSLLGQILSIDSGLPIILVNQDFTNANKSGMLNFIVKLSAKTPIVFFFDEFEKNFHSDEGQSALLGILDGITSCKALFILTSNSVSKLNENLLGRPGRVRYYKTYAGLGVDLIKDVVKDRVEDKTKVQSLSNFFELIDNGQLTLDKITKFIDEVNYYPEKSYQELITDFNLIENAHHVGRKRFKVKISIKGKELINSSTTVNLLSFNSNVYLDRISLPDYLFDKLKERIEDKSTTELFDEKDIACFALSEQYYYGLNKTGEALQAKYIRQGLFTQEEVEDFNWCTDDISICWTTDLPMIMKEFSVTRIVMEVPQIGALIEMVAMPKEYSIPGYGMSNLTF